MAGRKPSERRRMKSSVSPTTFPSRWTGIHDVIAWTWSFASTASSKRTSGSRSSATPPSVNPISGSPLSATHSSEMSTICSVTDSGAAAKVVHRASIPSLAARLRAVRTSWNFLPLKARSARSTTVSSPTCKQVQPWSRAIVAVSSPTEYRHGVHPLPRQYAANSSIVSVIEARSPIGSVAVRATPEWTRYATACLPSVPNQYRFPAQVVIHDIDPPPGSCRSSRTRCSSPRSTPAGGTRKLRHRSTQKATQTITPIHSNNRVAAVSRGITGGSKSWR